MSPVNRPRFSAVALVAAMMLSGCTTAPAPREASAPGAGTKFVIGPAYFRDGDSIRVDAVECSSPKFAAGDRVVVRGWYDLNSEDGAVLGMFVTPAGAFIKSQLTHRQVMKIPRGVGPFEFEMEVPASGALYVSFFPSHGGHAFGRVYFGTKSQMDWASGINLW